MRWQKPLNHKASRSSLGLPIIQRSCYKADSNSIVLGGGWISIFLTRPQVALILCGPWTTLWISRHRTTTFAHYFTRSPNWISRANWFILRLVGTTKISRCLSPREDDTSWDLLMNLNWSHVPKLTWFLWLDVVQHIVINGDVSLLHFWNTGLFDLHSRLEQ